MKATFHRPRLTKKRRMVLHPCGGNGVVRPQWQPNNGNLHVVDTENRNVGSCAMTRHTTNSPAKTATPANTRVEIRIDGRYNAAKLDLKLHPA